MMRRRWKGIALGSLGVPWEKRKEAAGQERGNVGVGSVAKVWRVRDETAVLGYQGVWNRYPWPL
jgi:hypothetical protein